MRHTLGRLRAKVIAGVTVRSAQAGDIPQMVELNALVQADHVAARPAVFKPAARDELAAWFAAGLDSGSLHAWVALDGADLVGYVTVHAEQREEHALCYARAWWEVDALVVRPAYRRRGVARALLRMVATAADQAGVGQLQLSTWSFNTGAQEAWRHLGFTPMAIRYAINPRRLEE